MGTCSVTVADNPGEWWVRMIHYSQSIAQGCRMFLEANQGKCGEGIFLSIWNLSLTPK